MTILQAAINRQIEWQSQMNSNYETMYLAWVEELGELVASTGYADWKKAPRDYDNMLVEAVDLLIFTINLAHYNEVELDVKYIETSDIELEDEFDLIKTLNFCLTYSRFDDIIVTLLEYFPKILDLLVAKQALNSLRQAYGYKTGVYIKAWPKGEDNVYLKPLIGNSYEMIYVELEETYTSKVVPSKLFVD